MYPSTVWCPIPLHAVTIWSLDGSLLVTVAASQLLDAVKFYEININLGFVISLIVELNLP